REMFRAQWSKTRKYYEGPAKKQGEGGMFNIIIDPSKCKGCAECVTVCDDLALKMIPKTEQVMTSVRKSHRMFKEFGPSDKRYISDNLLIDMRLNEKTQIYHGGDGAMFDIGFQSLSRLFASGMNIKVFVLDTQVYSNTGGQASTSSYTGQNTKMSVHGKTIAGKQERRKEIAQIAMMHPRTFVAQ